MTWSSSAFHPLLARGVIHVWRARLDLPAGQLEAMRGTLSGDEWERAARRRTAELRDRFIAGRGLLRALLGRYLGAEPASLAFRYGPHGKPALAGEEICFNLSHSHGLSLFAFARGMEIGVDLERVRPEVPCSRLARRFFSSAESEALHALQEEEQRAAFFRCWTRKEAYIKACGRGLSLPLNQFEVSLDDPPRLLRAAESAAEVHRWRFVPLDPGPNYAAALSVDGEPGPVECFEWDA